ncbi:MAG: response regulator [Anaerolineales bacterium]
MKQWQILIVDNHPVSRAGLRLIFESTLDFRVIGDASSGQQAIQFCQESVPDVILMDINMPNGNGIEATEVLHRQFPEIIIIAVSAFRHEEMQQEVMRAGASGYISKETDFADMIKQIEEIIERNAQTTTISSDNPFNLTHTELKVLTLLAKGYDRLQIADYLVISLNTVKMHFRNLYQKLGVANAHDAIKTALEHHLLS